ncbi:MAG: hypothetical protein II996_00760 [Oscillospiraceae bacterium]|nr:hypothetical protein [Oscillospiraceae bacterium]
MDKEKIIEKLTEQKEVINSLCDLWETLNFISEVAMVGHELSSNVLVVPSKCLIDFIGQVEDLNMELTEMMQGGRSK